MAYVTFVATTRQDYHNQLRAALVAEGFTLVDSTDSESRPSSTFTFPSSAPIPMSFKLDNYAHSTNAQEIHLLQAGEGWDGSALINPSRAWGVGRDSGWSGQPLGGDFPSNVHLMIRDDQVAFVHNRDVDGRNHISVVGAFHSGGLSTNDFLVGGGAPSGGSAWTGSGGSCPMFQGWSTSDIRGSDGFSGQVRISDSTDSTIPDGWKHMFTHEPTYSGGALTHIWGNWGDNNARYQGVYHNHIPYMRYEPSLTTVLMPVIFPLHRGRGLNAIFGIQMKETYVTSNEYIGTATELILDGKTYMCFYEQVPDYGGQLAYCFRSDDGA
ncbi:hypothetical protein pD_gene0002 [Vibrio phage 033B]|nr:hypothetical protein pD_gene0002 [Vibrio phage 033B]